MHCSATSDWSRLEALCINHTRGTPLHRFICGTGALVLALGLLAILSERSSAAQWHWDARHSSQNGALQERDARKSLASMRAARLLAGVAAAAALNPSATTRRQLGAGLAGAGLTIVAAPPALAEVLDIPPATTKMGGLLEKYADVARGARKL